MNFKSLSHKQMGIAAGAVLLLLIVLFFIFSGSNTGRDRQVVSLPAMGTLPALSDAMRADDALRKQVIKLFSYDAAYLFVNYREVNTTVADILFLWAGMTPEMVNKSGGKKASEVFLRRVYSLPDDEPIENNPLLGDRPWPRVFGQTKARLLMQGNAMEVFGDGVAYYDPIENEMVVNATLSKSFMQNFDKFVSAQPKGEQKRYWNNMLNFIENMKGLKTLSAEEKALLK